MLLSSLSRLLCYIHFHCCCWRLSGVISLAVRRRTRTTEHIVILASASSGRGWNTATQRATDTTANFLPHHRQHNSSSPSIFRPPQQHSKYINAKQVCVVCECMNITISTTYCVCFGRYDVCVCVLDNRRKLIGVLDVTRILATTHFSIGASASSLVSVGISRSEQQVEALSK